MNESVTYVSNLAAKQERKAVNAAVLYTLYTEDKIGIERIVGRHFDGFTILNARGYFRGESELSVTIEIVGTPADKAKVYALAEDIRRTNAQYSVLVTEQRINATFVEAPSNAHEAAQ